MSQINIHMHASEPKFPTRTLYLNEMIVFLVTSVVTGVVVADRLLH